jgi:hypothetical protein
MKTTKQQLPKIESIPNEILTQMFPDGFTIRDEANALTAYAFRNGFLEDLHAGKSSLLTDDLSLSRITNSEMKKLMIEASEKLAEILKLREINPESYKAFVQGYAYMYCQEWNRK